MEPLFWPSKNEQPIRNLRLKLSQGQIFWREVGRGNLTVVLLHGSWCDGNQWLPLLSSLGQNYHCLAPDLMGWGESSRLKPTAYSIELEVDCLAELLKALRVPSVYFVGHSLGAWVAMRYALKYPEQVQGLMVIEPEGFELPAMKHRWRNYRWLLSPAMGLWLWSSKLIMEKLGKKTSWLRSHHQRQQLRRYTAACRLLFHRRRAALTAEQLTAPVEGLTAPLLILQAEQASPTGQQLDQACQAAISHADLKIVTGAEDNLAECQPEALATAITDFLAIAAKP